jgi:hypothetical protein
MSFIGTAIAGTAFGVAIGATASAVVGGVIAGAVAGAIIGGVTAAIKGGNILKGVLVGGLIGGITGGLTAGIGAAFGPGATAAAAGGDAPVLTGGGVAEAGGGATIETGGGIGGVGLEAGASHAAEMGLAQGGLDTAVNAAPLAGVEAAAPAAGGITTQQMATMAGLSAVGGAGKAMLEGDASSNLAKLQEEQRLKEIKTTPVAVAPSRGTFSLAGAAPGTTASATSGQNVNQGSTVLTPAPNAMAYRNLDPTTGAAVAAPTGAGIQPLSSGIITNPALATTQTKAQGATA